jgi:hypothetical protein
MNFLFKFGRTLSIWMDRSRSTVTLPISWTETQRQYCTKITQKLYDSPISLYFRTPVDPVRDNALGYFDKVKKPMDLGTVLQRLYDGKYASLERWKDDVNQIWKNAVLYNGEGTLFDSLSRELGDMFTRYCEMIPKSDWETWIFKLKKTHDKLEKIMKCRPVHVPEPPPPAPPPPPPPPPPAPAPSVVRIRFKTKSS